MDDSVPMLQFQPVNGAQSNQSFPGLQSRMIGEDIGLLLPLEETPDLAAKLTIHSSDDFRKIHSGELVTESKQGIVSIDVNGVHIPIFLQPLIHPEVEVVHSVEMILGIIGFVTY